MRHPATRPSVFTLPSVRPPQLRIYDAEKGEPRHATWLELFYDLVFVVAVSQLAIGSAMMCLGAAFYHWQRCIKPE